MIYWQIFLAFFIPGIFGYGGGPSSIPLVEAEVVDRYHWMTSREFSEMLAIANALPGPIATKMAGYIGYMQGGILGLLVALFATIAPSLLLMIALLSLLLRHKDSPRVKKMSVFVRPAIAVLIGILAFEFAFESAEKIGGWKTFVLAAVSFYLLEKKKIHPLYVIAGALLYGAFFLS
ncbi:MAG: chromate transporter [Caldibacillus debilis]|jgi:chromate transporter|uniref:Chromate transport protein ChrA n=2 Tax=Caldibacillus debilis TaxID=301148 RepID=A0A420VHX4_9BACI|nr:chromate transporter [Caldibacillus debilis]MBY6270861.1 chromate transporter [Bacillaceae bacterium]OUM84287.1 MAG: transporter [Caldibacillus debilis]REJ17125.1 MAG: chromate transporter [Caldibacillus debilis]REJ27628.1 MAG: chromate transporter [Caldibacillus debilis]REJ30809.1 MAG: chromate transporter [Caldibacillus debilis]